MRTRDQNGIALIIVLWMMVVLSVLVISYSAAARTEIHAAAACKNEIENKLLAEAGIQRGIMEIYYRMKNKNTDVVLEGLEVMQTDATPYPYEIEDGRVTIRIADETGKLNINTLTDSSGILLNSLLVNLGIGKEQSDTIVDSILDWKDKDDLVRLHGAEDSHYASLPEPYKTKNAPFESLEELLSVKGMTREILYGTAEKKGLIHFVTIYSGSDKISLNAAPREVLMAVPGMTEDAADNIITVRSSLKTGTGLQDIQAALGPGYLAVAPYVTTGESGTFTIDSTGCKQDDEHCYHIKMTLTVKGADKYQALYYKSPAHVIP